MSVNQTSQRTAERDGFSIDWSARLAAAGFAATDIADSAWSVSALGSHAVTLVVDYEALAGALHKVWLSGGAAGEAYEVTSTVTLPAPGEGVDPVMWASSFMLRINP